jgi:hypothetical protein
MLSDFFASIPLKLKRLEVAFSSASGLLYRGMGLKDLGCVCAR